MDNGGYFTKDGLRFLVELRGLLCAAVGLPF